MRVHVLGAGALGCLFGGLFAEGGARVTFVDARPGKLAHLREHGLRLEEGGARRRIEGARFVSSAAEAGEADLLLILVKAGDTLAAASSALPCAGPRTLALTLQNGLGNVEALRDAGLVSIAAGITSCGAFAAAPGHIRLAGRGETIFGWAGGGEAPPAMAARLEETRALFERSGLCARLSGNISGWIWTKLLANAGINPVTALCGVPNGVMAENADARELLAALVREGAAVAAALGIRLETPDPVAYALNVAAATAGNRSSMLQDVRAGRRTEIAAINGAIAARGEEVGVPAPLNAALARLIRIREGAPPGGRD